MWGKGNEVREGSVSKWGIYNVLVADLIENISRSYGAIDTLVTTAVNAILF